MANVLQPCCDCGRGTPGEYYMVHDAVWDEALSKKPPGRYGEYTNFEGQKRSGVYLCIACLEKRLGRKLNRNDFMNIPMNFDGEMMKHKNLRLRDRLQRQPDDAKLWPSVRPKLAAATWYKMAKKYDKVVIVDFDETIAKKGYPDMGEPYDGVQDALGKIKDAGYKVRIFTCRMNNHHLKEYGREEYYEDKQKLEDYLKKHKIPFDDIVMWWEGKPFADYYIDDKAIHFDGKWGKVIKKVLAANQQNIHLAGDTRDLFDGMDFARKQERASDLVTNTDIIAASGLTFASKNNGQSLNFREPGKPWVDFFPSSGRWRTVGQGPHGQTFEGGAKAFLEWYRRQNTTQASVRLADKVKRRTGQQHGFVLYDVESTFTHKMVIDPNQEAAANTELFGKQPVTILWGDPANNFWGVQMQGHPDLWSTWYGRPDPKWDITKATPEKHTFYEKNVADDVS